MVIEYTNFSKKVFPGFYETTLYSSGMFDYCECPDGFYLDFKRNGFQEYQIETSKDWAFEMARNLKENPIGIKILGYVGLDSPKEYNFYTDVLTLKIKVNVSRLKKFCLKDNRAEFDEYLKENWTSYDGFVSFIPNDAFSFEYRYANRKEKRTELIEIMTEWYLLKFIDFDEITMSMYEGQYERLSEKTALISEADDSEWNYDFDGREYIPTEKIA